LFNLFHLFVAESTFQTKSQPASSSNSSKEPQPSNLNINQNIFIKDSPNPKAESISFTLIIVSAFFFIISLHFSFAVFNVLIILLAISHHALTDFIDFSSIHLAYFSAIQINSF